MRTARAPARRAPPAGPPPIVLPRPEWSGPYRVLDIETAPDRHAQVLARRQRGVPDGSPLQEIVAASVLSFDEKGPDGFGGFDLRSWHREVHLEADILLNVEAELAEAAEGGTLVTFNGRSHDLPVIRVRQMRWWLCDADAIPRLGGREDAHVDVMLEMSLGGEGRWPTLADACAAVGFSLAGATRVGRSSGVPVETEKCERDVVGTAMLFLHLLAARRRSLDPLSRGLPALGRFLREEARGRQHLERFALNRMLEPGARAWGAVSGGN